MDTGAARLAQCITDERLAILAVDDAFLALVARERSELIGRSPLDFTAPADRLRNGALLRRLTHDGAGFAISKRYVRGDGRLQWVRSHVLRVGDGAGSHHFLATCSGETAPGPVEPLARSRDGAQWLTATLAAAKAAFGNDVIAAAALEILLHLQTAELEGRSLTPAGLARLIALDERTTLRWLRVLEGRGFAECERGGAIGATSPVRITGLAQERMEALTALPDGVATAGLA